MKNYDVEFFRPSGNDTALVEGIPKSNGEKKIINEFILSKYKNIEQVGFYDIRSRCLEMAGGEFCGNATRAFVKLLIEKTGLVDFELKISGTTRVLRGGIRKDGEVYAEMPIKYGFETVTKLPENVFRVEIEGITILLDFNKENFMLANDQLKEMSFKLINKYCLTKGVPACGVMTVNYLYGDSFEIKPVVWVRDIETLFFETACGSGTTALGIYLASIFSQKQTIANVTQPSGKTIKVLVKKDETGFRYAEISGEVELLEKANILIESEKYERQ